MDLLLQTNTGTSPEKFCKFNINQSTIQNISTSSQALKEEVLIVCPLQLILASQFYILQFWVNTQGQIAGQGPGSRGPGNKRHTGIFFQWEAHGH